MKILICLSNVPDTTTKAKFVNDNKAFDTAGVQWIINPWDELALTRALELKANTANSIEKVTVITVGKADAEPTMRKALAIGADDAVRIDAEPKDAYFVAAQIAEYVKTKELIFKEQKQSDFLVLNYDNPQTRKFGKTTNYYIRVCLFLGAGAACKLFLKFRLSNERSQKEIRCRI